MKKSKPLGPLLALVFVFACGAGSATDETDVNQLDPQGDGASLDAQDTTEPGAAIATDDPEALMSSDEALVDKAICYACEATCTRVGPPNCGWGCCYCNGVRGTYHKSSFNPNLWLCDTQ